jgi:hypothetical protein
LTICRTPESGGDVDRDVDDRWYWDRRIDKAYRPVATDGDRVALVTVWHRDEVEGAIDAGALDDVDDVGGDGVGFDYFDSFRLPDGDDLAALLAADADAVGGTSDE